MKLSTTSVLTVLLLVILQAPIVYAQSAFKLKSYTLTVRGTSSLHDWESAVTKIVWKGNVLVQHTALASVKDIEVKIPVESIKSTKGRIMDNKTYEAFGYEKNPFITYTLAHSEIKPGGGAIEARGNLTMAGTTKAIDLLVQSKVLPNGDLQLTGSKKIKMRDFGMEPPTAMMGTIKVGDEVTFHFEIVLTAAKAI